MYYVVVMLSNLPKSVSPLVVTATVTIAVMAKSGMAAETIASAVTT